MTCRHSAHPANATLPPAFLAAVQELRAAGREPYAYGFPRTHTAAELQQLYADLADGAVAEGASVAVAGRVMSRRFMGKLAFFKLVDASGSVQVGVRAGSGEGWTVAHAIQDFQATRLTLPAAAATCQENPVVVGLANAGCTPCAWLQLYIERAVLDEAQPEAFAQLKSLVDRRGRLRWRGWLVGGHLPRGGCTGMMC